MKPQSKKEKGFPQIFFASITSLSKILYSMVKNSCVRANFLPLITLILSHTKTSFMSLLKRQAEIKNVEKKANQLLDFISKNQIRFDLVTYGFFARKEITSSSWGFDKNCLLENMQLCGFGKGEIEKNLTDLQSNKLFESFNWRSREVFDFAYRENAELQRCFLKVVQDSTLFKTRVSEIERNVDAYLLHKIKEEKDEKIASLLRLLFSTPMPEIGKSSDFGSIAEFHFRRILGERWIETVIDLLREKVLLTRLNFLSTNVAIEYFVPEYSKNLVFTYLRYANLALRRALESLVSPPLFGRNFEVSKENRDGLLERGLCYRRWTTPKVSLTEEYIPTSSFNQVLVEEIPEIPQMIIKSYPDDELWTYYLIGSAMINARESISISSPYTDQTTLTHFVKPSPKDVEIRILTTLTGGEKKEKRFFDTLQEMWNDGYRIEILKIQRESKKVPLHARYLIQDNKVVVDLPGDLKWGFSGTAKAENVKWIPLQDKIVTFNDQFNKFWNLSFSESDFLKDPSSFLGVKLSFTAPYLVNVYKISLVGGKVKKEEKTMSFDQFASGL